VRFGHRCKRRRSILKIVVIDALTLVRLLMLLARSLFGLTLFLLHSDLSLTINLKSRCL
jgi:hypothetical protein